MKTLEEIMDISDWIISTEVKSFCPLLSRGISKGHINNLPASLAGH